MAEETKFSETSVQLTEAAPQTVDRFTAPGNIYSAILSRNEAVKDARRLKEFQELKDKYVHKKVIFEDPLFPAQDSSLFYSEKFPLKLEWKRPSVSGLYRKVAVCMRSAALHHVWNRDVVWII